MGLCVWKKNVRKKNRRNIWHVSTVYFPLEFPLWHRACCHCSMGWLTIFFFFKLGKCISDQMKLYQCEWCWGCKDEDALSVWPPFNSWDEKRESPAPFQEEFWILVFAFLLFHILVKPFETMNHGVGAEKPPWQLMRAKYPLDLLVFLFSIFLFSYPNDTKVLLQVSCDHSSDLL